MKIAELFRIDGQVALVTGGASGIGYACAEAMADNGAKVCVLDRDVAKLEEARERLAATSADVHGYEADVTDLATMRQVVSRIVDRYERLDIAFIQRGDRRRPGLSRHGRPAQPRRCSRGS
jgi:NAD(P)-dependent dehydrogenase (short-subunit alcohol dehydrogenase family)